ncbi:hypothetical protein A2U01_0042101 [Trifolium medium]|uniref:Uncharacterized protein n=1 Tax=Trifolium medium TaxID=97028 RepID=A0A392QAQ3_9FABA|nr:hypothetical protein [Trifolium medium]
MLEFALNNKVDPSDDIGKTAIMAKMRVTVLNVEVETVNIRAGGVSGG